MSFCAVSVFLPRSQANDLAVLVSRMQKNADKVEKNILQSEELLDEVGRTGDYETWTREHKNTHFDTRKPLPDHFWPISM